MRILLIEDDVSLCRSVRLSLEQQGFKVTVCHDGEEGLFYILENAHDLVLLDRMLPGMSGTQVLQKARQQHCTVPVIFLTALGSLEERITGLDCGADDYIVKPFALEELMARIRCVCRRPPRLNETNRLSFGDLTFDSDQSLLSCGTKNCTLSRREGELLALTRGDIDLEKRRLRISKSFQHVKGQDLITTPKTEKSNREIELPQFLCDELEDYFCMLYKCDPDTRLFDLSKSYLHHEMDRGVKETGVKRIRIHDLRHSHVAYLIELGFSPVEIAERLGHESISVTYTYSHLYPSKQRNMADRINEDREGEDADGK